MSALTCKEKRDFFSIAYGRCWNFEGIDHLKSYFSGAKPRSHFSLGTALGPAVPMIFNANGAAYQERGG